MSTRTLTPGRSASRRRNSRPEGLTLIELLVAMAIVGMIFAVAATGLRSVFNVNLKSSSSRLAGTLRYLSNKAVTENRYLRMVYDFESQSYHAEESDDPFVVSPEPPEPEKKKEMEGEEKPEEEQAVFSPSESKLLKPTKLPSGVFFKDVTVSYLPQKQEGGQVFTYFFPDGYATATVINLRDEEDQEHFSIELFALSGRVRVEGEYKESSTEEKKE